MLSPISVGVSILMIELYNPFASGCCGGFWYLLDMWGEAFISCLGGITANHCCRFNMKKYFLKYEFKEPNPSMGNNDLSLYFAVLYSVQFSCKCIIWMSVQWAHYLYCFQAKYFQEAVLLWHFTQVHLVPWRKLTKKSHSTSAVCI